MPLRSHFEMRVIALFFTLCSSTTLLAYPYVFPERVSVHVGETAKVHVTDTAFGVHGTVQYATEDPSIATGSVALFVPGGGVWGADMAILGIAPGQTRIVANGVGVGIVTVSCGSESMVALNPEVRIPVGLPVTLSLTPPQNSRATFTWYRGRIGDTSTPLVGANHELAFTPTALGTDYVWVLALDVCGTSSVEFRIDAIAPPRRRSARS